jgi:hypothetical protein
MSLLSRGTEVVTVYPEEVATDADGNTRTRPSATGVVCRAVVQPITSAVAVGNQESQEIGFLTESKYRLRLVGFPTLLGAQSQVEWQGKRYAIEGEPRQYNGSRRTAHVDYIIERR